MCALSSDTQQFLRHSRLMVESSADMKVCQNSNTQNELWDSPRSSRQPPAKQFLPEKKTLMEMALQQKTRNGHVPSLAHSSSAPSLFDPLAGNMDNELQNSKSSSDITRNSKMSSNVKLLAPIKLEEQRTDNPDPFLELISQRHKTQPTQHNTTAWVESFQ